MNLTTPRSLLLLFLLFSNILTSTNAFPTAAGHCLTGDLTGKNSGHGETGGGPLSNGNLQVRFDDTTLSSSTTNTLNANQEYTVILDFSTSNPAFFFRGLLFRLSGKNGEDVSGTFYVGSDSNVQLKSGCASDVSAVTHTNRLDKTSVSFNFEYTGSTTTAADLLLEVTVVRERAEDNWFYSSYDIEIGSTSSCPPDNPFLFKVKVDGQKEWKACTWAVEDTETICQIPRMRVNCPTTCNQCDVCQDSKGKFKYQKAPGQKFRKRKCSKWVSANTTRRCQLPGIADACPNLCETCTST